jgi:hypothetical protein
MSVPELEAGLAWLQRNRLSDHLHLLAGDARYAWTAPSAVVQDGSDCTRPIATEEVGLPEMQLQRKHNHGAHGVRTDLEVHATVAGKTSLSH